VRIDRPICKDTELHPLVRWQFVGNFPEDKRRAFLFTNVVGAKGERYDMPVVVGALAATNEIYAMGMGVCPFRSRRRASTLRPISPPPSASPRTLRQASATWAPIAPG